MAQLHKDHQQFVDCYTEIIAIGPEDGKAYKEKMLQVSWEFDRNLIHEKCKRMVEELEKEETSA